MNRVITHTVNFVLALRDSWSDRLIGRSDFVFFLDGMRFFPIKKESGYYVFVNLEKDVFSLRVEHSGFYSKELNIDLNEISELDFVLELPLVPKFQNKLPLGCSNLYGRVDPNTEVYIVKNQPRGRIQFAEFKDDNVLVVSNSSKLSMLGATLAILGSGSAKFETFCVLKKYSCEEYKVNKKLTGGYKKGDLISKAYLGIADSEGNFSMFVGSLGECKDYVWGFSLGGKSRFEKITLDSETKRLQAG
ncbi:hypothetical protein FACS1894198_1490 [Clostridia bacterium]|nr:hypothetical protein FACS1894198_1490 [Clostridia bacterium]